MKEIRSCELRAENINGSKELILIGRPVIYNQQTEINDGGSRFIEVIRSGALDGCDLSDVRLLVNHDQRKIPLARTPKTMTLTIDSDGLVMRATLPDTEEGRAVHTAVCRSDLTGMSFAFTVPENGDSYEFMDDVICRTITKIKKIYECSIVSFPAYEQTSIEAGSVIAHRYERNDDVKRLKCLVNSILLHR